MPSDRFNELQAQLRQSKLNLETKLVSGQEPTPLEMLECITLAEEVSLEIQREVIRSQNLLRSDRRFFQTEVEAVLVALQQCRTNLIRRSRPAHS